MAASIKEKLNLDTDLEPGGRGEFSIWLDGNKIVEKTRTGFPSANAVIDLIQKALE